MITELSKNNVGSLYLSGKSLVSGVVKDNASSQPAIIRSEHSSRFVHACGVIHCHSLFGLFRNMTYKLHTANIQKEFTSYVEAKRTDLIARSTCWSIT